MGGVWFSIAVAVLSGYRRLLVFPLDRVTSTYMFVDPHKNWAFAGSEREVRALKKVQLNKNVLKNTRNNKMKDRMSFAESSTHLILACGKNTGLAGLWFI